MTARLLGVLILCGLLAPGCGRSESDGPACVRIGQGIWEVELATDPKARHRGLAGRKELPTGTGMFFVFPDEQVRGFHMLDCHVPLDIAFISSNLIVVEMRTMRVEADPSDPKAAYSSRYPIKYALEVPAGELARDGVAIGDRVELLGTTRSAAKGAR